MQRKAITTGPSPRITLGDLPGDVRIKGWDRPEIVVEADGDAALTLEATAEGGAHIHCVGDCRIHVPRGAALDVHAVRGDARIGNLGGGVSLREVSGDLRLRRVGPTDIGAVFGDLSARGVDGPLTVANVYGDAAVDGVRGAVTLARVGADLRIGDVDGDVTAEAGADVTLDLGAARSHVPPVPPVPPVPSAPPAPPMHPAHPIHAEVEVSIAGIDPELDSAYGGPGDGDNGEDAGVAGDDAGESDPTSAAPGSARLPRTFDIKAGADISLRVPAALGATIVAAPGACDVTVTVPNAHVDRDHGETRIVLGDGRDSIRLAAGGSIVVGASVAEAWSDSRSWREIGEEFRGMADQFARRMEAQFSGMSGQLSERLSHLSETLPEVLIAAGLSDDEAERFSQRIRQAGERAAERAQRHIEHATRTVQRQAEQMQRRTIRVGIHADHGPFAGDVRRAPARPRAPEAPAAPVGSEERRLVLRMLEQGKISADEAERLLAAMEGRRAG